MPLPIVLVAAGLATALTGALASRRRRSVAPQQASGGPCDERSRQRTAQWRVLVEQLRGPVPAWLMLGHICVESGGDPRNVASVLLKGERGPEAGLMQIPPSTADRLGRDYRRLLEPAYNIETGSMMLQMEAAELRKLASFATDDDLWRTAYFRFALGGGSVRPCILGAGLTWSAVAARAVAGCAKAHSRSTVLRAVANNETVWQSGHLIAQMTERLV
jgi:hypothetical protein